MIGNKEIREAIKIDRDTVSLVLQKEYLFCKPDGKQRWIGALSVRGCYAILLYNPIESAVIHWDDNTSFEQLDKVVTLFLNKRFSLSDCSVTLVGGWPKKPGSVGGSYEHGLFLKKYFTDQGCKIDLNYFQKKTEDSGVIFSPVDQTSLNLSKGSKTGFSFALLNVETGKIRVSDDWRKSEVQSIIGDIGLYVKDRNKARLFMDSTHFQSVTCLKSGTRLFPRDGFKTIQDQELNKLCIAAKENNREKLVTLLDDGLTDVNLPGIENWTPLHFACKMGNFECAELLIDHGADINSKTNKGSTPLQFIKNNPQMVAKLSLAASVIRINFKINKSKNADGSLSAFSIFARHPEQLSPEKKEEIEDIKKPLSDPDEVRQALLDSLFDEDQTEDQIRALINQ